MSEAGVDMERCMQGVDDEKARIPKITWHNCAELMPQDDKDVICKSYVTDVSIKYTKVIGALFKLTIENWQWTEFTKEKLEELNK